MLKQFQSKVAKFLTPKSFGIFTLVILWAIIVSQNYNSGTWLLGWDNLVPELNLGLNIKRAIFAVWQDYQGLGLEGGLAHAADLSRQILLIPIKALLPLSAVRYAWTFLMLLLGPLGVYALSYYIFKQKHPFAALLAGVFYLLNLATVQYFYVPLETFSSFYGFLPWLILAAISYLDQPTAKNLLKFFLLNAVATSAFHVQTLFVVYAIILAILVLTKVIHKRNKEFLLRVLLLGAVTLAVNAFWLLPVLHFTATNVTQTTESLQNLISTPETRYMNSGFGRLSDIALMRGYWFEYTDFKNSQVVYLLKNWRSYYSLVAVKLLAYFVFAIAALGVIFAALARKRNAWNVAFAVIFLLSILMLTGGNGILGLPFRLLSENSELFAQVFRVSFTKWSMVLGLCYSLGIGWVATKLGATVKNQLTKTIGFVAAIVVAMGLVLPIFQGNLIYDRVSVELPQAYPELFEFFAQQPKTARIAVLPIHSMWGWDFHTWGYRGSGFIWYGIEQPILHRNFDVWSKYNESFYKEIDHALKTKDVERVLLVLKKYQVNFILFDASIVNPSNTLIKNEGASDFAKLMQIEPVWQQDFISVYDLRNLVGTGSIVSAPEQILITSNPLSPTNKIDNLYAAEYSYLHAENSSGVWLPFYSLGSNEIKPIFQEDYVVLDSENDSAVSGVLEIPALQSGEFYHTRATTFYEAGKLSIEFDPPYVIATEQETFYPFDLPSISIEVPENWETVVLVIKNTSLEIQRNSSEQFFVSDLIVGETIQLELFDKAEANFDNNAYYVPAEKILTHVLDSSVWSGLLEKQVFPLNQPTKKITLKFPNNENSLYEELLASEVEACDTLNRGRISKKIETGKVVLRSQNRGVNCLGLILANTNSHQSYFLRLEGANNSGRPLKLYVENIEGKFPIFENILSQGSFDNTFVLHEATTLPKSLYWLQITDQSFGLEQTENIISNLTIYNLPLPAKHFIDLRINASETEQLIANRLEIKKIRKLNSGLYEVDVNSQTGGYLVLHQAFDVNWQALTDQNQKLAHFPANNWENAWEVPGGIGQVTIKYQPQVNIYVGYLIFVMTLAVLLYFYKRR